MAIPDFFAKKKGTTLLPFYNNYFYGESLEIATELKKVDLWMHVSRHSSRKLRRGGWPMRMQVLRFFTQVKGVYVGMYQMW